MLQAVDRFYRQVARSEAFERARGALMAHPVARKLARNQQEIAEALGWSGWVLAGGFVLFASWELVGFSALLGHHRLGAPEFQPPALTEPAPADTGCTQAPLNRATGVTVPADCRSDVSGGRGLAARLATGASRCRRRRPGAASPPRTDRTRVGPDRTMRNWDRQYVNLRVATNRASHWKVSSAQKLPALEISVSQ